MRQIIKFNKPILIEKQVCLQILNNFINLINRYPNHLIYVNHFHFFDNNFTKIIKSLKSSKRYELRIIDGDQGPKEIFLQF